MSRDMTPLPVNSEGNGANLRTLTFDIADAPMLFAAMMIAGNKAMMGNSGKAENRLRHYQEMFLQACPAGFRKFPDEEDISSIAIAMMDAETCTAQILHEHSWDKSVCLKIAIGDQNWTTNYVDRSDVPEMIECLKEIAPMTCAIETLEDAVDERYKRRRT